MCGQPEQNLTMGYNSGNTLVFCKKICVQLRKAPPTEQKLTTENQMHKNIFRVAVASLISVFSFGCHPAESVNPNPKIFDIDKSAPLEWRFYSQEASNPTVKALFEEAQKIVNQSKHPKGKLESASRHLGPWFIIEYPDLSSDPNLYDESPNLSQVYLVDLHAKRLITHNDWNVILPLYQLILRDIHSYPDNREHDVITMAEITSIVAFGHQNYNNPLSDENSQPVFESDPQKPDSATLWYYIHPENAFEEAKIHCVLKISESGVDFSTFKRDYSDNDFNPLHEVKG